MSESTVTNLIAILLCLILIPQLALASEINNLKSILDNYTYAVTVEWDQKDKTFSESKARELETNLRSLIAQGLTLDDFMARKKTHLYSQGSSWGGGIILWSALATVMVTGIVLFLTSLGKDSKPSSGASGPACTSYSYECHHVCEPRYDYANDGAYYEFCYDSCEDVCQSY